MRRALAVIGRLPPGMRRLGSVGGQLGITGDGRRVLLAAHGDASRSAATFIPAV